MTPLLPLLNEWVCALAEPADKAPREPLHALLLAGDGGDRAAALLFERGNPEPLRVLKTARGEAGSATLENEARVLRDLHARTTSGPTGRHFPAVLGYLRREGMAALLQEAIPGPTWFQRLRAPGGMPREAIERLVRDLFGYLQSFDVPVNENPPGPAESPDAVRGEWIRAVDALANHFSRDCAAPGNAPRFLDSLKAKIPGLPVTRLQHGDLFPKNVILPDADRTDTFVLIDWADAGGGWPPLFDEVLLFTTLWWEGAGIPTPAERTAHFQKIFWGQTPLTPLMDDVFTQAMKRRGVSEDWTRDELILLALAVYGRRLVERNGPTHPECAILTQNLCFALSKMA